MNSSKQHQMARAFQDVHRTGTILILPNAWDVASARLFEREGFTAIGTTSAGIAASLGYPDGQRMSLEENLTVVRRICAGVGVPVSADIEAGYVDSVEGSVHAARKAIEAGAVGLNIEDGTSDEQNPLGEIGHQAEKIIAIREMAAKVGVPIVINARTDVYLVSTGDPGKRLRQAIERGNAYRQAGADCVFVPDAGGLNREIIAALVSEIEAPINVLAGANIPTIGELQRMGVKRVSLGPRPFRATLGLLRRIAQELKENGAYSAMSDGALSYAEVNAMFRSH